jgi:hypothetical protein
MYTNKLNVITSQKYLKMESLGSQGVKDLIALLLQLYNDDNDNNNNNNNNKNCLWTTERFYVNILKT